MHFLFPPVYYKFRWFVLVLCIMSFQIIESFPWPRHAKRVFGHMRTAKSQISLCIYAVWWEPSLSANIIIRHYKMYQCRANTRMKLCACVGWHWICTCCACSKTHLRFARSVWCLSRAVRLQCGLFLVDSIYVLNGHCYFHIHIMPHKWYSIPTRLQVGSAKTLLIAEGSKRLQADCKESEQTTRMRRMICFFAWRTCNLLRKCCARLIFYPTANTKFGLLQFYVINIDFPYHLHHIVLYLTFPTKNRTIHLIAWIHVLFLAPLIPSLNYINWAVTGYLAFEKIEQLFWWLCVLCYYDRTN